jgi:hypothetical protein
LDIKRTLAAPANSQCNSEAEMSKKTLVKYIKNVVGESMLNWE